MSDGPADDHGAGRTGMYLLFALVIALAVATLWYVARPAIDQKPAAERSCEVIILASGRTQNYREEPYDVRHPGSAVVAWAYRMRCRGSTARMPPSTRVGVAGIA
jgi:hypothetical protein